MLYGSASQTFSCRGPIISLSQLQGPLTISSLPSRASWTTVCVPLLYGIYKPNFFEYMLDSVIYTRRSSDETTFLLYLIMNEVHFHPVILLYIWNRLLIQTKECTTRVAASISCSPQLRIIMTELVIAV